MPGCEPALGGASVQIEAGPGAVAAATEPLDNTRGRTRMQPKSLYVKRTGRPLPTLRTGDMTQDTREARFADAAVHLLTALHAVSTRLTLTDAERRRVDCPDGGVLEPGALWGHSCALFGEADDVGAGAAFDLGCAPLLLGWLGFADEAAFHVAFGCLPSEALGAFIGRLRPLAHVVETLDQTMAPGALHALARVWCRRARVLADLRPRPLAETLEAVERALACPPENDSVARSLLHCKAELAHLLGDEGTEHAARLAIDEVERRHPGHDLDGVIHETTARLACFWWMAAHGVGLLESERETLDVMPGGDPLWSSLRRALREGQWDELPIPIPTAPLHLNRNHWSSEPAAFLDCLKASAACGMLEELLRVVELVLGRHVVPDPDTPGVVPVVSVLVERRARLEEEGLQASAGPIFFELHQGARLPDAVERIELIRGLHPILARVGAVVPFAPVAVYLDRASESEARGDYADERCALEAAVELSSALADPGPARARHRAPCGACMA